MAAPWELGAAALADAYRAGETGPLEVVRALRERIARLGPALNAFAALDPTAQAQAGESARRLAAGAPRSGLEGVPVAVKDNLAVAGMPAAWGSAVFAGPPCAADELPVARLRAAGAIVLGKTTTPEFSVEGYTASARFGVTRNPWDPALTPGGSSGGSVAAVAAGLAPVALGTDGGGSIRRPAGHTGLYGLKPGIGAVPRAGGLPQLLLDFEVVGPVARSAADLRLVFDALRGPDRADPRSRARAQGPARREGLRILYAETLGEAPCDARIRASVGRAAARLAAMGHVVERGALPFDLGALNEFWGKIAQTGLARLRAATPAMAGRASAQYLAMADAGDAVPARDFLAGLEAVTALRAAVSRAFGEVDIIMTPTAAAQPWPAAEPFPPAIDGRPVGPRGHAVYTGWVNAAGHPAVALPAGPAPDGMPIGFQLVGDLGAEDLLLDLAAAWERAGPGWRWPDLARA